MSTVRSAARVAVNENLDCYENLANAIILQAVKDYKKALRQLEGNPRNQEARHDKVRLEKFFRSQWYGVLGDDMVDGDHIGLALPPKSGIRLLVQFQAPRQSKPDQDVSALLDIQSMSG